MSMNMMKMIGAKILSMSSRRPSEAILLCFGVGAAVFFSDSSGGKKFTPTDSSSSESYFHSDLKVRIYPSSLDNYFY